jgi:hypothetical protein
VELYLHHTVHLNVLLVKGRIRQSVLKPAYGLDDGDSIPGRDNDGIFYLFRHRGVHSPGLKRPWHEADHSPPPSAEVKNAWVCTSTHPIHLHGVVPS